MTFDCGCGTDPTCCGSPLLKPILEVDFPVPEFEGTVKAMSVCSCPCEEITVSLSASCCFEKNSCSGSSVTARGEGTVSASVSGGSACCGPYTLLINGSSGGSINVNHGDGVSISVVATGDGCGCCNTGCNMGTFPDCSPSGTTAFLGSKAPIYVRVGNKLYLNEQRLLSKLRSIKKREYFVMRKPKKNINKIAPKIKEAKRRPHTF